jgi:hypothetical protein
MRPYMPSIHWVVLWLLLACVASAAHAASVAGTARPSAGSNQQQRGMLMRWFSKMDVDKDGELQAGELRNFIGAQLGTTEQFNTGRKLDHAIEQVSCNSGLHFPAEANMSHIATRVPCKLQLPA